MIWFFFTSLCYLENVCKTSSPQSLPVIYCHSTWLLSLPLCFTQKCPSLKRKRKKGSFIAPADETPFSGVCSSCFILILFIKTLVMFLPWGRQCNWIGVFSFVILQISDGGIMRRRNHEDGWDPLWADGPSDATCLQHLGCAGCWGEQVRHWYIYIYICLVGLCVCVSLCVCVCPRVHVCVPACMCVSPHACVCIHPKWTLPTLRREQVPWTFLPCTQCSHSEEVGPVCWNGV